jgi:transcriptional regulator with GAF, ATPase, and Fis domain
MKPRVFVLAGPVKGSIVDVEMREVTVGRSTSNGLYVPDSLLSRRHCAFVRTGDQVVLRDLQSLNGTFVNGVPIKERVLQDGDHIQIGQSVLFLSMSGGDALPVGGGSVEAPPGTGSSTIEIGHEDTFSLRLDELAGEVAGNPRLAAHAGTLLKLSTALMALRDPADLQRRLLQLIVEIVPADRAALLLVRQDLDLESVATWSAVARDAVHVDFTVARRSLQGRMALVMNDVSAPGVQSILCSPLVVHDRPIGVAYVTSGSSRFERDHLQFATAAAAIGATALEHAGRLDRLEEEATRLRADLTLRDQLIGESLPMKKVGQFVAQVAPSDSTVLIYGESGTGKELVAKAIHAQSPRAAKRFAAINCATLSETLLESTLFGHERGAFTGAVALKKGMLEVAQGGSVFLDEVGDLPTAVQARLLRVVQEREFERVGGTSPIAIDIRLIAATNRDLKRAVAEGSFREDLYFRLNVIAVTLPPLRNRRDDIELLAMYFVRKYATNCRRKIVGIAPEALTVLVQYSWPGNVRELENAMERAVVMSATDHVLVDDLPEDIVEAGSTADAAPPYFQSLSSAKKEVVRSALEQAAGDYTRAAQLLGVHVNSLHRMIRVLGLKRHVHHPH